MRHEHFEFLTFMGLERVSESLDEKFGLYMQHSYAIRFPDMEVVRKEMTKFYADPSNQYLDFTIIFLVSGAKIRGYSPKVIQEILAKQRRLSKPH